VTEKLTKTQIIKETTKRTTKTTEIKTETREIESELDKTTDEHTWVELRRDNGVELGECVVTRCEQQDSLLQGRGETLFPLEADRDEVGPLMPNEVERMSAVNGCTRSLGDIETPGPLVVAQVPGVVVPVCVAKCVLKREYSTSGVQYGPSIMACVSARMGMDGPEQMGEGNGGPKRPPRPPQDLIFHFISFYLVIYLY